MSQALPERNWRAIRIKIYEITGTRSFHIAPKVIRDEETYAAYLERLERKENSQRHTGSARWQKSEMNKLDELWTAGATQLAITAALSLGVVNPLRQPLRFARRGAGVVSRLSTFVRADGDCCLPRRQKKRPLPQPQAW